MTGPIRLLLTGDVMTGRGIDQILPNPSEPTLYEPYVRDARDYVRLAENINGPIPRPVDWQYVWGEALAVLDAAAVDARIVNLETSVTRSSEPWPGKGINYRMHPANIPCLTALGIDCCVLANNHVLDWEHAGLEETLACLQSAGMRTAGAGRAEQAAAPGVIEIRGGRRLLVFAYGSPTSGIPRAWGATDDRAGVNLLHDLSPISAAQVAHSVAAHRQPGDVVVVSVHWGGNWGYGISPAQRAFARALIDAGGADVIHGHSSHHAKGIEVYRERPIIYGCGDFLNDYEGIAGYEHYRGDLSLMYLPRIDADSGALVSLEMRVFTPRRFSLQHASTADRDWLLAMFNREGVPLGTSVEHAMDGVLVLHWGQRSGAARA